MQSEDDQWVSPSFNSYSSNRSADIAVKVMEEVDGDEIKFREERLYIIDEDGEDNSNNNHKEEEEFEFSLVEDEIYFDGQTRPIFPVFNRDLLIDGQKKDGNVEGNAIRIPLKKLFIDEREGREPPSEEEDDECELESMPPGTYCVWKAKTPEQSPPSKCKKSNSTGSGSKRPWKLLDLLRRSNSDGKDSFVFLTPKKKEEKHEKVEKKKWKVKASSSSSSSTPSSPLHYAFTRNKAKITKGNETPSRATTRPKGNETPRRKTYLPYRQDLVGFFATVNGFGRNITPF